MTSDSNAPSTRSERLGTRRPSSSGGFTLIELVVVLVVVAILAATAAPAMNSIGASRARLATDRLERDLTFARQRSLATGETSWVVFDTVAESWQLLAEDPGSPGRAGAQPVIDPGTGQPYGVTLGTTNGPYPDVGIVLATFDGGNEVGFDWLGRPLNDTEAPMSAFGRITITGANTIWVWPDTGHCWIP